MQLDNLLEDLPAIVPLCIPPAMKAILKTDLLIVKDAQLIQSLGHNADEFGIALMWCLSKDKRGIKLDRRKPQVKHQEPLGAWLYSILRLCQQCHGQNGYQDLLTGSLSHSHPRSLYQNADDWFIHILQEIRAADLNLILRSWDGDTPTKEKYCSDQRSLTASLSDTGIKYRNPLDPTLQPHFWNLLECSIVLASRSEEWYQEFFRGRKTAKDPGFIFAHRLFVKSLEKRHYQRVNFSKKGG